MLPPPWDGVHFNLSQCSDLALDAVSGDGPVGVDLEMAREGHYRMACLCDRIGVSERHLRRVFEDGLGISAKEWLRKEPMVAARSLLREGSPIKEVAIDLGFTTAKIFSRDFQTFHGVKPTDFQRKEHAFITNAVTA